MPPLNSIHKTRILHFVTGGGSGATRVALDLALAQQAEGTYEPLLLLRRKSHALPASMATDIKQASLQTVWIENSIFKSRVIKQLVQCCVNFQPQIFVAHGNSEHLWGRQAALQAGSSIIIHVEHNIEKYYPWRLKKAQHLATQTHTTICVSPSVENSIRQRSIGARNTVTILNGIDYEHFATNSSTLRERPPDILMAARFSKQKDHATLIQAVHLLADTGWQGHLLLAGGGNSHHRKTAEKLVKKYGLTERVKFLGYVHDMPHLLRQCRVFALSTHYEGLPLALAEAMAAGCAIVASRAPGVTDIVKDHSNGRLFPTGNATALAIILQTALEPTEANQQQVNQGQKDAKTVFSRARMIADYHRLFQRLLNPDTSK
ncbi:MAG: glycosyltransferase [Puniceicoccales bacterium]|jgi:glycosyltransferase involved in cell wall biosynthesis|nr:glycosyltransferase [Puniceicoccales bacterium]